MEHDPVDAALLEHLGSQTREAGLATTQMEIGDFKWIVSNKRGRRFIWRLLEKAGVFRPTFTGDPQWTAFNEGNRNYGLWVWAMVQEHAPESYALMLSEHNDHRNRTSDR